ncbi:MAG: copper resistance protein CopC [Anaerolineales bacterium]
MPQKESEGLRSRLSKAGTRAGLAGILSLGLALLLPALAEAHASYLRSEPGQGAAVALPPARVDIWFTQELFRRQGENLIAVSGPDGQAVQVGDPVVDDDDRTHLWVPIESNLLPGAYQVTWRSLSAEDGDRDEGEFAFVFDPAAAVTSSPMEASLPTAGPPTMTAVAVTQPTPTPTPAPARNNGCSLGLLPVLGLAGVGWRRRRGRCAGR